MSTAKKVYDANYLKANYDNIVLRVKKGKHAEYKQAAENFGISLRELLQSGVEEFIASHIGRIFRQSSLRR